MGIQEKGFESTADPEYRITPGLRSRLAQPTIELMTLAPASATKTIVRMDRQTLDGLLDQPPLGAGAGAGAGAGRSPAAPRL
jgi:hypothetical protein